MNTCILLSGGLDSAILAGMLRHKHSDLIAYGYEQSCNNIFFAQKISSILGIKFYSLGTYPSNYKRVVLKAAKDIKNRKEVNIIYCGVTKNPDIEIKFNADIPTRLISAEQQETSILGLVAPFSNMTKLDVLRLGMQIPEIADLILYTHTCCATKGTRCNKCFNCQERAWAFSELGLIDYGKY